MAKSCWSLLGVKRGATERDIKVAYAKRLKVTRPEDDPEAFQRLVEARNEALAKASRRVEVAPRNGEELTQEPGGEAVLVDVPKGKKRKSGRAGKSADGEAAHNAGVAALSPDDATGRIADLLSSEVADNSEASFDEAVAVLRNASFSERAASEERLLWSVGVLADRRFPDSTEQEVEPMQLTSPNRYMIAVLAEEFHWLEDEQRVASISSWHSPRLLDLVREAIHGPAAAPPPEKLYWYNNLNIVWFLLLAAYLAIKILS
jgi:hypothetical protein